MFINNTTSGKRFQVDITDTDTVRGLKAQITDELGVPAKYQHISFNGMNLRDDTATLSKYQMGPSSEVDLHIALNGGIGAGCHICNCAGAGCHCTIL